MTTPSALPAEPADPGRHRFPEFDCEEGTRWHIFITPAFGAGGSERVRRDAAQVLHKIAREGNLALVRSAKQVRVFSLEQDGRVVAAVTYTSDKHGDWYHIESLGCGGAGSTTH